MPDKRPTKPFNLHADPDQDKIRDKDNVSPKLQPTHLPIKPAPNLAPAGMAGIKRGLPSNADQSKRAKRFTINKKGELSKKFKSIAPKSPDRGRGWER